MNNLMKILGLSKSGRIMLYTMIKGASFLQMDWKVESLTISSFNNSLRFLNFPSSLKMLAVLWASGGLL